MPSWSEKLLASMRRHPEGRWVPGLKAIIDEELALYKQPISTETKQTIPDTTDIPLDNPTKWIQLQDVICCFVDMLGSTKLSVSAHPGSTARLYRLFTSTAIRVFNELGAPYIDVKGDGVFAMFDKDQSNRALAATVSFKTFVTEEFVPIAKKLDLPVEGHYGIDKRNVLVRRMGLRRVDGRTDRQNEVWAGKPVNFAAKLAGMTSGGEILISQRFYEGLTDDAALLTCGCPDGVRKSLWTPVDVSQAGLFDFDTAYKLKTQWCVRHGRQFCSHLLGLEN